MNKKRRECDHFVYIEKFLQENDNLSKIRPHLKGKMLVYDLGGSNFGAHEVKKVLSIALWLEKVDPTRLPFLLRLGRRTFADKLSFILLECICYYLITCKHRQVYLTFSPTTQITSAGIQVSPLHFLSNANKESMDSFIAKFKWEIKNNHFRKLFEFSKVQNDPYYLSKLVNEISWFLNPFDVSKRYSIVLAEVVAELIENSIEHAGVDCLLDIDVSPDFIKKSGTGAFRGINVAVVNFSDILLGTHIKEKLSNDSLLRERDIILKKILSNHSHFWDEQYKQEDFYNIASFQDRISGRNEVTSTGGTGLTKLISSLERESPMLIIVMFCRVRENYNFCMNF